MQCLSCLLHPPYLKFLSDFSPRFFVVVGPSFFWKSKKIITHPAYSIPTLQLHKEEAINGNDLCYQWILAFFKRNILKVFSSSVEISSLSYHWSIVKMALTKSATQIPRRVEPRYSRNHWYHPESRYALQQQIFTLPSF